MTFNEYQQAVMRTAGPALGEKDALILSALGISGEGGEVVDHIKKHLFHGHTLDISNVLEELGDLLWYIARMCEALETNLDNVVEFNIDKLRRRYPEGFSSERSINREGV